MKTVETAWNYVFGIPVESSVTFETMQCKFVESVCMKELFHASAFGEFALHGCKSYTFLKILITSFFCRVLAKIQKKSYFNMCCAFSIAQ
jgi:hypothetical protein